MKNLRQYPTAALTLLRGVAALVDVRDLHFYGGLILVYLGARALHPALGLIAIGSVLMLVGLLYRGKA